MKNSNDNDSQTSDTNLDKLKSEGIDIQLQERDTDIRSNVKSYNLVINNYTDKPVQIKNLKRFIPLGVTFEQINEASILRLEEDYKKLCEELRILIYDENFFGYNKNLIEKRKKQLLELIKEVIGEDWTTVRGIIKNSFLIIFRPYMLKVINKRFLDRYAASQLPINSYSDAVKAIKELSQYQKLENDFSNEALIRIKLGRLDDLEKKRLNMSEFPGVMTIEKYSKHVENYILKFTRNPLEVKKYTLSFSIAFTVDQEERIREKKVSTNVEISAYTWSLSLVAILFGIVGALMRSMLKFVEGSKGNLIFENFSFPAIFIGGMTGFIIFNAYEYLGLSLQNKVNVSWRSAMLIGLSCGLTNNNFIKAIEAFLRAPI